MNQTFKLALSIVVLVAVAGVSYNLGQRSNQKVVHVEKLNQGSHLPEVKNVSALDRSDKITWRRFDEGLKEAKETGKPIFVEFFATWCGYCKKLDMEVLNSESVYAKLNTEFIPIRVVESSEETVEYMGETISEKALTHKMQVTGFPTLMFMESDGKEIAKVPGFVPKEQFLSMLGVVTSGEYKKG